MNIIGLNHGSGGRQMHELIKKCFVEKLKNGVLEKLDDSAVFENSKSKRIAMTTDSYVVNPLFFDGGDIGRLCICGTVNDLATSGSKPFALSLSFILEEGVSLELLERIVDSIMLAAKEAKVRIVTGDTKVVEKGKCDQVYINTCGIGFIEEGVVISSHNAQELDSVIISGPIGNHEIALVKARGLLDMEIDIKSDVAPLNVFVEKLLRRTKKIHAIKDPTRGGLASALIEICEHSNCEIVLKESEIPVDEAVLAVCELVGFDPLYLANEGKYVIVCESSAKEDVLETFGSSARVIGDVVSIGKAGLILKTVSGGMRKIGMLETTQLPRIC